MDKIDYQLGLSKAMRFCSSKEVCQSEIVQKCLQWGLSEASTHKIIERLVQDNFIDEERYANAFVSDKFRFNKWGKIKIAAQLRLKQIDQQVITESLSTIDEADYLSLIKELLASKKVKAQNEFEKKQKLIRFLSQRGFESEMIYRVLSIG